MANKVDVLGVGAVSVSIASAVLSLYAGYRLQSTFYYAMFVMWSLVTYLAVKVYFSLKK